MRGAIIGFAGVLEDGQIKFLIRLGADLAQCQREDFRFLFRILRGCFPQFEHALRRIFDSEGEQFLALIRRPPVALPVGLLEPHGRGAETVGHGGLGAGAEQKAERETCS